MKKIYSIMMFVAVAAMALVSCQKQEIEVSESVNISGLTFTSEKPAFDDETKTEWTGSTIQWSKGDKIRVAYTCDGVWQNAEGDATADEAEGEKTAKLYASTGLDAAKEVATFVVPETFKGKKEGIYQFYGIYPSTLTSSTTISFAPSVSIDVPSEQTPTANSFDAAADVMVAQSDTYNGMPKEGEDNGVISLKWSRLVAHGHLTLKALAIDGQEKVESIVLTANVEADMVGKHYVDFETQTVEKAAETATNIITIDGTNLSIDAEGNVSFWASFLPCTWTSLTVDVETNKASYTREIDLSSNQKSFLKNARNTLAIGMATATRIAKETPATDYSGSYVIVAKRNSEGKFYYLTGVDCGASTKRFVAELAGETCPTDVEDLDDTHKWEVSKFGDAYLVTCVAGGQISWTSGNSAFLANTGLPFVVAENEDGTFTFKYAASDGDRYISLNNNTGNNYFALYKSGQVMDLYLLPVTPDTTPKVTLEKSSLELTAEASEGTISVSTKYVSDVRVTALVEEDSQEESEWLTADYADGVITYSALANDSAERTAYIEVYVNGEDGSTLSMGIVVTQAAYVAEPAEPIVATIQEFLAAEVSENILYQLTGTITNIANATYGNFTIEDATASVYIYGLTKEQKTSNDKSFASLGLKVGDDVTLVTVRGMHNETPQGGGQNTPAYYISHVSCCADPIITCADNIVTITAEEGATIYYTTDGSDPTESSEVYSTTTTIEVTETNSPMTVKAIAVADDKVASSVVSKTCTYVDPNAGGGEDITVTTNIADYASNNSWTNGTKYTTINIDDNITATAAGTDSNTGKYYTSGTNWRLYQTGAATLTITAAETYTIKSVKITYTVSNTGILTLNGSNVTSETVVEVNANSITFGVGNTGTKNNGQVRVTAIEVVYQAN